MFFFDYLKLCLIHIHLDITIALSIATTIYTIIYLSNTDNNPIWQVALILALRNTML